MGKIVSTLVIIVAGAVQMIAADAEVNGVFKGNDQPAKLGSFPRTKARR
jgi:hypothetical protein